MKETVATAKTYLGVIFDLDGVICRTDEYHYMAWKALAKKLGIKNFTRKDNRRLLGVSRMESLEVVLEKCPRKFTEGEKLALAEEKNKIYLGFLREMSVADLSEEVSATLGALKAAGLRLAIGSSSKNAKLILQRIGLGGFFDAVCDGGDISKCKPDPEVFLRAAQMLGLQPFQCLVVEDAVSGIIAAHRGGFDCAGISGAACNDLTTYPIRQISQLTEILHIEQVLSEEESGLL